MKLSTENIEKLKLYVSLGYINETKHPKYDLNLYKYTKSWECSAKGKSDWDDIMLLCRGLVLDTEYNIVSRSYKKFFNVSDYNFNCPDGRYIVREKMDGSMINVFRYNGELIVYTLGSFASDQAIYAHELIKSKYVFDFSNVEYGYTYAFELIAPFNKIVIDYGDKNELVFLAQFDVETGKCINMSKFGNLEVPRLYQFNSIQDIISELKVTEFNNLEGYVVTFVDADLVIKFKYDEYFKLHKLLYGLTKLSVYKVIFDEDGFLKSDTDALNSSLSDLPDEFLIEYNKYKNELISEFQEIENSSKLIFESIMSNNKNITRKDFALLIVHNYTNTDVLFKMFDGMSYAINIYKKIRPYGD